MTSIPANQAHIAVLGDDDGDLRVLDINVLDRRAVLRDPTRDAPLHWSTFGASDSDWLQEPSQTPAAIFGRLLHRSFDTKDVLAKALNEFSKIDGCEWAAAMKHGFEIGREYD